MNDLLKATTKRSIVTTLIIGLTAAIPLPALAQSNSKQIWSCQAENRTRQYVVNQLDLNNPEFDIEIYAKDQGYDRNYIGTVPIKIDQTSSDYIGTGRTYNSRINVSAFGRTADFLVDDSKAGSASGRCWVSGKIAPLDSPDTRTQSRTNDEREILSIVDAYNQKNPNKMPTIVTRLVTSQSYGLYRWVMGKSNGQTMVKKGNNGVWTGWIIRRGVSSADDIETLQKWGVPKPIALDLVWKMNRQVESDRYAGE